MTEKTAYVICPCCGATVPKGKFCPECGYKLDKDLPEVSAEQTKPKIPQNISMSGFTNPVPVTVPISSDGKIQTVETERAPLSDEGLTLLADACRKTIATVGGDGYTEIVLYIDKSTGEYWVHTYSKYVYMEKEAHSSYAATPELAEKVMNYIEERDLASRKDSRFPSMPGGDYILRFRHDDEMIRLDYGMMAGDLSAYNEISKMLYSAATEQNRRYSE